MAKERVDSWRPAGERYTTDVEPVWVSERAPFQIYYLDHDARQAAEWHCDTHVARSPVEIGQILSAVWHVLSSEQVGEEWLRRKDPRVAEFEDPGFIRTLAGQRIYRAPFRRHPHVLWAAESTGNYDWLWRLGAHLCDEYQHRFKAPYVGPRAALWALERPPPTLPEGAQSEPSTAMSPALHFVADGVVHAVASYRAFYAAARWHRLHWTRRPPPPWLARRPNGEWFATGLAPD